MTKLTHDDLLFSILKLNLLLYFSILAIRATLGSNSRSKAATITVAMVLGSMLVMVLGRQQRGSSSTQAILVRGRVPTMWTSIHSMVEGISTPTVRVTKLTLDNSQAMDRLQPVSIYTWWWRDMETVTALLALWEGNPPVTGGFPYRVRY